jgi:hypothetical protein
MKRTSPKIKRDLKKKRRFALVRATVRELTPTELGQINGANETIHHTPTGTGTANCCVWPYSNREQ